MNDTSDTDDAAEGQLEIVELLDERFRLREDPTRAAELEITHARLRERLHGCDRPESGEAAPAVIERSRARKTERPDGRCRTLRLAVRGHAGVGWRCS